MSETEYVDLTRADYLALVDIYNRGVALCHKATVDDEGRRNTEQFHRERAALIGHMAGAMIRDGVPEGQVERLLGRVIEMSFEANVLASPGGRLS